MKRKLLTLVLAATLAAAPTEYSLEAAPESYVDALTTCTAADAVQVQDVTAAFPDKQAWDIPGKAQRGYVFSLTVREEARAAVTAEDCKASLEGTMELATRAQVQSLRQAGLYDAAQAASLGYELYVDVDGFWGLNAGWQRVSSRTRLRDVSIPAGMDEMFVSPAYLYERYLQPGAQYARQQRDFVGVGVAEPETGLVVEAPDTLLVIFHKPMAVSAVETALKSGTLPCGPYTRQGDVLHRNQAWWGVFPYEAQTIQLK